MPDADIPCEEWRPVFGYEGLYEVSDQGRVRGLDRIVPRTGIGALPVRGRVLRGMLAKSGYPVVTLRREARSKVCTIHRLVLAAFVGPCPTGMEACHADGTRTNNRLENLRWDTRLGNAADMRAHGTHGSLRLTDQQRLDIADAYIPGVRTMSSIGAEYGVSATTVCKIIHRKSRRHANP